MFWFFGPKACGILVPWPGIKPAPPALEGDVLTTGPPGKSLWRYSWLYFYLFFRFQGQVEITKWILIITFTIMNEVLAALSKYNLNTIKFIHLKYTVQWFLVYLQSYVTMTTISFRIFSSPPKETCYLFLVTPHLSIPRLVGTTNLLSVSIDLPVLDNLYKWNHIICAHLWLVSFN